MSADCSKLMRNNALANCGIFNAGIEADLFLMAKEDIASYNVTADGVVNAVALKANQYAVRYQGRRNSYDAGFAMVKGTFNNAFEHHITCRTFVRTQELKDQMNRLAYCRVVAFVRNADSHNMETKYEIYGIQNGMLMSEIDWTGNADEGWLASFSLQTIENESTIPLTFYNPLWGDDMKTKLISYTQLQYFTLSSDLVALSLLDGNDKLA